MFSSLHVPYSCCFSGPQLIVGGFRRLQKNLNVLSGPVGLSFLERNEIPRVLRQSSTGETLPKHHDTLLADEHRDPTHNARMRGALSSFGVNLDQVPSEERELRTKTYHLARLSERDLGPEDLRLTLDEPWNSEKMTSFGELRGTVTEHVDASSIWCARMKPHPDPRTDFPLNEHVSRLLYPYGPAG